MYWSIAFLDKWTIQYKKKKKLKRCQETLGWNEVARERDRQRNTRTLTTTAKSVVTTFGLIFFPFSPLSQRAIRNFVPISF